MVLLRSLCNRLPGPGLAPAGEALFFASPKKSTQKKGDPAVCDPSASLRGNLGCSGTGCAVELAARCALRSDNHGKSVNEACVSCGTPATPSPARPRRIQKGRCGPLLRSAPPAFRAIAALAHHPSALSSVMRVRGAKHSRTPGRAQQWPVCGIPPSGCAEERRARGGRACRRTRALRDLTRRGCPSGARSAQRVPRRRPATEHRRLPRSPKGRAGSQTAGSPFLWLLSFGEAKESDSPAGARPGPRP